MPNLEELVYTALGEASMCWSETPKGVFDCANADRIGKELIKAVKECEHDFDTRVGEYNLVKWCQRCGVTFVAYRGSPYKQFSNWKQVEDDEVAESLVNQ